MAEHKCEDCGLRAKYDQKPKSFLGRLWRFHANWCPGWRAYMQSLPDEQRQAVAREYGMKKYQL